MAATLARWVHTFRADRAIARRHLAAEFLPYRGVRR
jgi:hypothetical protein